jgi:hypothetical protein
MRRERSLPLKTPLLLSTHTVCIPGWGSDAVRAIRQGDLLCQTIGRQTVARPIGSSPRAKPKYLPFPVHRAPKKVVIGVSKILQIVFPAKSTAVAIRGAWGSCDTAAQHRKELCELSHLKMTKIRVIRAQARSRRRSRLQERFGC